MNQPKSNLLGRMVMCAAVFLTFSLVLSSQSPASTQDGSQAKPAAAEQAPAETAPVATLRTNVDEVSLDLVVHDKGKHLILDLKPEDLAVTDDNTPVKLTGLRLVRGDSARRHAITFVFDPFVGPTAKSARSTAEKVLKVLPTDGYSIAVLDLRGRLRLIQGFTEDRKAVSHAIEIATASQAVRLDSTLSKDLSIVTEGAEATRTQAVQAAEKDLISIVRTGADAAGARVGVNQRAYAQTLFAALQESQKVMQEKHGYVNLGGLLAVIHSQQKLADRKAVVYFTHNMVMDSAAKEMLKTISADSTRAGVTIYIVDMDALNQTGQYQLDNAMLNGKAPFNPGKVVVDPHGDMITPMQQMGGGPIQGDPSPTGPQWGPKQDIEMMTDFTRRGPTFSWGDTKSPMAQLSNDTGGIYIDAENSLKKPLQQMAEDLNTYYEATYVPPIKDYDGSFRTIAVKPLRSGIRVQSKTGYFAVAPGSDESIRPFELPLIKTLTSASLPSDVKFRASVIRFGDLPDGNTNTLAVEIPFSGLQVKEDAHTNLFSAQVAVFAEIKDADGTVVERFGENISRRGALETLDRDHSAALTFERHFVGLPGKYTLEVAVSDQLGNKTGAQRVNFEIPNAPDSSPALSDMVLVRKMTTVREDEEDALDPLRYQHDRVTPDLSGQLAGGAKRVSLFFMLHPDPSSSAAPTLEMQAIHNGTPGRRIPLPLEFAGENAAIPYLASFGPGSLAPGEYQVKAYLSQGGKTAVQTIAFSVAEDSAAAGNVAGKSSDTDVTAIAAPPEVSVPGQLMITAMKDPVPPLSAQEAQQLIADARERALGYHESLPNFMCLEVINRSVDSRGIGDWKLKDTIVELLRYRDKQETRTTLEVNGQASNVDYEAMKGSLSIGEFGGILRSVFEPGSEAHFSWAETNELSGGQVQVYNYSVDQPHSKFGVVGTDGREIIAGFHGQVFIDSSTRAVRRISLIADLPRTFTTHWSSLKVDYDYVAINGHDYLLPVSAEMRLSKGRHNAALNTIEFRNYKRFGSNMKVLGFTPIDPQKN